jgi:hypothetical protein
MRWRKGQEILEKKYQIIHTYNEHTVSDMAPFLDAVNGLAYISY